MYYDCSRFFGAFGTIYTLADKNKNVFYIGCTLYALKNRLTTHIWEAKNGKTKKCEMIRFLNYQITATVIDVKWVTGMDGYGAAQKLAVFEKEWIEKYKALGIELCNKPY